MAWKAEKPPLAERLFHLRSNDVRSNWLRGQAAAEIDTHWWSLFDEGYAIFSAFDITMLPKAAFPQRPTSQPLSAADSTSLRIRLGVDHVATPDHAKSRSAVQTSDSTLYANARTWASRLEPLRLATASRSAISHEASSSPRAATGTIVRAVAKLEQLRALQPQLKAPARLMDDAVRRD